MKNFDTRTYNISDFQEWQIANLLDLSPQFQRRSVWTEKAKSYLIDTILRGRPIPKVLMTQNLSQGRNIRTVVDGQQRLRTILSFISGDFKVSRAHNKELANLTFDELPDAIKSDFLKYEIGVDMLFDLSFEDILDVFARLNTYSVKLNEQELLNAQYLGFFKQTAYSLGYRYVRYWIDAGVLSEKEVTRMAESELASDLLGTLISGIQSKKAIPSYYKKFDDDEAATNMSEEQFHRVMAFIGEIYPAEELKQTNFTRIHFFHSLFSTIAHALFGLPNLEDIPRAAMTPDSIGKVRACLDDVSAQYDQITNGLSEAPNKNFKEFIDASRRATTDAGSRKVRTSFLTSALLSAD